MYPSTEEGSEDFLFNGKEKDSTGLYYYGARYYDPDLGRFLTRDPLKGNVFHPPEPESIYILLEQSLKIQRSLGLFEKKFAIDDGEQGGSSTSQAGGDEEKDRASCGHGFPMENTELELENQPIHFSVGYSLLSSSGLLLLPGAQNKRCMRKGEEVISMDKEKRQELKKSLYLLRYLCSFLL